MNSGLLLGAAIGGALFVAGIALPRAQASIEKLRKNELPIPPGLPQNASVDVIIPAYLESGVIGNTIKRLHDSMSQYEGNAQVIVVASDADTAQAAKDAGADQVIETARLGKASAINAGVAASTADVVVLSDGNCDIQPASWIQATLDHLSKWHLVSANKEEKGSRESAFWMLERWIKRSHAEAIGTLSVVGEFIAIRRADFRAIPQGTTLDDQWLALELLGEGKVATIASEILTIEPPVSNRDQWERRVRIASGLFYETMPRLPELAKTPQGRFLIAHKLYRATVGAVGFWVSVACLSFAASPWSLIVGASCGIATLMYAGVVFPRLRNNSLGSAIGMQGVLVAGAIRAMRRTRNATETVGWTKVAR